MSLIMSGAYSLRIVQEGLFDATHGTNGTSRRYPFQRVSPLIPLWSRLAGSRVRCVLRGALFL